MNVKTHMGQSIVSTCFLSIAICLLLFFVTTGSAHAWPGDLHPTWSSPELDDTNSVAWGDWDGDGDLDLAVGNGEQPNRVYENSGGALTLAWSSPEADDTISVAWGDWDGDDDLDLAVGNWNQPNRVYENTGGALVLAWSSIEMEFTGSVAWGDWDGDDDLDLAVGNWSQPNRVYENTGGMLAPAWFSLEIDSTTSVAWGDWDDDDDLDLVVGNSFDPNRVYENTGGALVLAWSSIGEDETHSVAWGDWDGDGDLDLAVGNWNQPNQVYENSGGALNLVWISPEADWTESVAWGDWDGDGDLDLAVGNLFQPNQLYENLGGGLALVQALTETADTTSIAWGDWDGDGDLDLAVGNQGPSNQVYENSGAILEPAWISIETDLTADVAWGDWDGDGDLDLATGNFSGSNRVYENVGGLLVLTWSSPEVDSTNSVAWGDWDGDSDLDLAVGNSDQPNRLYENLGETLALVWTASEMDWTESVAWGDWDGDGDLDLAVGNHYLPNRVYENTGETLNLVWSSLETDSTTSVAWGDWDGDGDLDLATGSYDSSNRVYENAGGTLTLAWSSPLAGPASSVAWGDWDGDGDLDLVVGNQGILKRIEGTENRVYENAGGTLTLAWSSPEVDWTTDVAWGDWDGDGDLDLAVTNGNQANRVYENAGGTLVLAWSSPKADWTTSAAWGDWDGDGDLDLAEGNDGLPDQVYENAGDTLALAGSLQEIGATRSIAWGDWDGDGDLDLAVGNDYGEPNRLYENVGGTLVLVWSSPEMDQTHDVAWGDWDGDGDLDLAVGSGDQPTYVYENSGGGLTLVWSSPETDWTESVAWGDWDGDGDLDLAVGNLDQPNRVYENLGGALALAWSSPEADTTGSVAWGDWDGDGDLDLAVGNLDQPNRVYENEGGGLIWVWSSPADDQTFDVAWGDWDGDGDLDLVAGNGNQPNQVYENKGGTLNLAWSSPEWDYTISVAWGDGDGDGDLDLAVGNTIQPIRVYENKEGTLALAWSSPLADDTESVAWADWDSDGDLDLVTGNGWRPIRLYTNHSSDGPAVPDAETTALMATPGPAAAPSFASATILEGPIVPLTYTLADYEGHPARFVRAYYSIDGGGDWRPAVAAGGTLTEDLATGHLTRTTTALAIPDGGAVNSTLDFSAAGQVGELELSLTVSHTHNSQLAAALHTPWPPPTGTRIRLFEGIGGDGDGFYSLVLRDRGAPTIAALEGLTTTVRGVYRPLEPLSSLWGAPLDTPFTLVVTDTVNGETGTLTGWMLRSSGVKHVYHWDVWGSGILGSSQGTLFRLEAYQGAGGPGPYRRPFHLAETLPFRVRGSQVRVMSETVTGTVPVAGAIVYRLPVSFTGLYQLYQEGHGQPWRTNAAGYLRGRGEIGIGDRLVALAPITTTDNYVLYYTNAAPTPTGLDDYTVTALGVQTLTVSAENPLLLFDLDLSLEWDARNDGTFLDDLETAIQRASEVLYDVGDGQMALGTVRVHQARENWIAADVVMYAQNGIRPRASMGGVVEELTDDVGITGVITNAYGPGQVRMGPNWDPFGQSLDELSQDWQRALAHELSHYLLYLPDNYLGVGEGGVPINTDCQGSFMTSTYDDAYSEFLTRDRWQADDECLQTVAEHTTGRADWQTVETFYRALITPDEVNEGPSQLPLGVTQMVTVPQAGPAETLPPLFFDLRQAGSQELLPVPKARGYLFKPGDGGNPSDDRVIGLGSSLGDGDRIKVRGAEPGDRLCLLGPFDESTQSSYAGCLESLTANDRSIPMAEVADWQPHVIVTAITSRTMAITVTLPMSASDLHVQVFPAYGAPTSTIPVEAPWAAMLPLAPAQAYTFTQVITLDYPAFEGLVRVWVPGSDPLREALSQVYLSPPWGPNQTPIGMGGNTRAWGANQRLLGAPVASGDGQVTIFNLDDIFADTGTVSLQAINDLPGLPMWLTPVGQGYRFVADEVFPRAMMLNYLQRDVPEGYEHTLHVYYSPDEGGTWQRLVTDRDADHNQATAQMPDDEATGYGQGIYAVLSTIDMPPFQEGWNQFGYPLPGAREVTLALASIEGAYTSVYFYDTAVERWHLHDATVLDEQREYAGLVNDLAALEFGRSYWLYATEAITLYLGVPEEGEQGVMGSGQPPATFYGPISPAEGFTPTVGLVVTATVGGVVCGSGVVTDGVGDGSLAYVVQVAADTGDDCGAPGRTVVFVAGGQTLAGHGWDNSRAWYHPLAPQPVLRFYLPLIFKDG